MAEERKWTISCGVRGGFRHYGVAQDGNLASPWFRRSIQSRNCSTGGLA